MSELNRKTLLKDRRKRRVRFKLQSNNKLKLKRVSFIASNRYLYAQLIDSQSGKTLFGTSTLVFRKNKEDKSSYTNKDFSKKLADSFFDQIKSIIKEDESFIFDRGFRLYHGKVKDFVEQLRSRGLKI